MYVSVGFFFCAYRQFELLGAVTKPPHPLFSSCHDEILYSNLIFFQGGASDILPVGGNGKCIAVHRCAELDLCSM